MKYKSEYQVYLDELEANRKQTQKNECKNDHHNWHHYYQFMRCAVCGEYANSK